MIFRIDFSTGVKLLRTIIPPLKINFDRNYTNKTDELIIFELR